MFSDYVPSKPRLLNLEAVFSDYVPSKPRLLNLEAKVQNHDRHCGDFCSIFQTLLDMFFEFLGLDDGVG